MEDFSNVTLALDTLITNIFITDIEPKIPKLENKYKEELFINQSSLVELTDMLKLSIKKVLTLISSDYNKVLMEFFSEEGLIYYIESSFYKIIMKE